MDKKNITVVICCAGIETRLGIGSTKSLVKVQNKSIIARQLELLKNFDDIRIVVGYQAENVIKEVTKYRKDVMFAFNYDYEKSGIAESLRRGIVGARENILYLDGDVVFNEDDFNNYLDSDVTCIAVNQNISDSPVCVSINNNMEVKAIEKTGNYCWINTAIIKKSDITLEEYSVYEIIKRLLPLKAYNVRARVIDTVEDYERAVEWVNNGCIE